VQVSLHAYQNPRGIKLAAAPGIKKEKDSRVSFDKGDIPFGSDTDRIIGLTNKRHVKSDQLSDRD